MQLATLACTVLAAGAAEQLYRYIAALPVQSLDGGCPASLPLQVTAYAIDSVQQRGRLFVTPGDQVYEGQVIGIYQRQGDLKVGWGGQGHGVGWRCGSLGFVDNGM